MIYQIKKDEVCCTEMMKFVLKLKILSSDYYFPSTLGPFLPTNIYHALYRKLPGNVLFDMFLYTALQPLNRVVTHKKLGRSQRIPTISREKCSLKKCDDTLQIWLKIWNRTIHHNLIFSTTETLP